MESESLSAKLCKPPKELSSWKIPLSELIEEYFDNLGDDSEIHFGEAALIIQNCVNAYARKLEQLYDETHVFKQKLLSETKENEEKQQKERRSRKSQFDFSSFEPINFDQDIKSNICLKNRDIKPIKFLHHHFSQLENTQARITINVHDIDKEIIGKKYDFRLNQSLNKLGMLVGEFNYKSFQCEELCEDFSDQNNDETLDVSQSLMDNSQSFEINPLENVECDITSDHEADVSNIAIFDVCSSTDLCSDHSATDSGYSTNTPTTDIESIVKHVQSKTTASDHLVDCLNSEPDYDSTFEESNTCDETQVENLADPLDNTAKLNEQERTSTKNEIHTDEISEDMDKNLTDIEVLEESFLLEVNEENPGVESINVANIQEANNQGSKRRLSLESSFEDNTSKRRKSDAQDCSLPLSTDIEDAKTDKTDSNKENNTSDCSLLLTTGIKDVRIDRKDCNGDKNVEDKNDTACTIRRSKRLNNNYCDNELEPVPFKEGIPEKTRKARKEFRLPCHPDLLKKNPSRRKSKRQKITKATSHENSIEILQVSKSEPITPLKIKHRLSEDEQKESQNYVDESFLASSGLAVNYTSVTTNSMDLLGFRPDISKTENCLEENSNEESFADKHVPTTSFSPSCSPLHTPRCSPIRSPPHTPAPSELIPPSKIKLSLSQQKNLETKRVIVPEDFKNSIQHKINQFKEELDIEVEDRKVAEWHEKIKPKLKEAERKTPFRIVDYESKILKKLEPQRRLSFEEVVGEEPENEVARYFSAALQLASKQNINLDKKVSENSIEVILLD